VWFESDEVARLAKSWTPQRRRPPRIDSRLVERNIRGKIAAQVFKLLSSGASLVQIVIATEADPLIVRELEEEYRTSFDTRRADRKREKIEAQERADQRAFEKAERDRTWREQQVAIAKATGRKTA